MLGKEIRDEIQQLRAALRNERREFPLNASEIVDDKQKFRWEKFLERFRAQVVYENQRIEKFNLLVPILNQQMMTLRFERELEKATREMHSLRDADKASSAGLESLKNSSDNDGLLKSLLKAAKK